MMRSESARCRRRDLLAAGATAAAGALLCRRVGIASRAAEPVWRARQFHNQPVESHQHRFLVEMWDAVRAETNGGLDVSVHAQNGGVPGSDPEALEMLRSGDLEFFTLMGGILGKAVPVAEIQGIPFAFRDHAQVYGANDGALGALIGEECAAKGIHRFQHGLLENGFRQICMIDKPIRTADDLAGVRMRVPDGQMFRDLFEALDAQPVTVNIRELYDALKTRRVDGQENPLVVTEVNRLYEVSKYVSMTNHMWSGFNLLANLRFWNGLPPDVQRVVERNVRRTVPEQRAYTIRTNQALETKLVTERGMVSNSPDIESFRRKLGSGFYRRWKAQFGPRAWALLEASVGPLV